MTVFSAQHPDEKNALGSGVMIRAFQDGQSVDALWLVRGEHESVITDTQIHKIAEGFARVLSDLPAENLGLKTGGMMLHFNQKLDQDVMYLTERRPEKARSAEGGVSVATLEFRIRPELSKENRDFITAKLSTPGVLKDWLDSIDMGPNEKPSQLQARPLSGPAP